jgi:hypothetical protein
VEVEEPGLLRFWFEFDLTAEVPAVRPGYVQVDGGTETYRLLSLGAGVTGYDQRDCLTLLERALGVPLPALTWVVRQPDLSWPPNPAVDAQWFGNPVWRGIWFPPLNRSGPVSD